MSLEVRVMGASAEMRSQAYSGRGRPEQAETKDRGHARRGEAAREMKKEWSVS